MYKTPTLLKPHRVARLIAWLRAMLAWAVSVLWTEDAPANRRHIRQRYRFLSLDRIERYVRALAIIRAMDITRLRVRRRGLRNTAGSGFRRRTERAAMMRAVAGSRFRKALKHRDPVQRVRRLFAALADIDAFARRYLVPRALRRLTRLYAVLVCAPSSHPLCSRATPAPCGADTS